MGRVRHLGIGFVVSVILGVIAVSPAAAYGNSHGAQQLYQVTGSMSCNNPDLCGANLGGFWVWGVFYADGTYDAEMTLCARVSKPGGPGLTGATHEHQSGTWTIADFGLGPWIVATSEVDVLTGTDRGVTVTIPSEFVPIGPAMKVHLSTAELLGFSGPGVTFQLTVTPMHVR
jgi:hypothetical protein